ncbi:MAG: glycosyltransferase [Alicyclobacillaceae bacterium]|nr:glycosyltransferase [Alicyclobacillaceae bacterium]
MTYLLPLLGFCAGLYLYLTMPNTLKPKRNTARVVQLGVDRHLPRESRVSRANVSIIIPARNEEVNLQKNLPTWMTLAAKLPRHIAEVMVVDDHSEDRTTEVAAACGARTIATEDLPEGWYGKPHALMTGSTKAFGSWLLMVDADVSIEVDPFAEWLQTAIRHERYYSIQPYHQVLSWFEQASALPGAVSVLAMHAGSAPPRTHGGFGPFVLCPKKIYQHVSGHSDIRSKILENFYLAMRVGKASHIVNLLGRGYVRYRMYSSLSSLWQGWTKSLAVGATAENGVRGWLTVVWIAGLLSCWPLLFAHLLQSPLETLLLYVAQALLMQLVLRRIGSFWSLNSILFPLSALLFLILFLSSVWRVKILHSVQWKGRTMHPTKTSEEKSK